MQKYKKINSLAKKYILSKDQEILHQIMDEFHRKNEQTYIHIAKWDVRDGDVHRVKAEMEDTILKALEIFDPSYGKEFEHLLNKCVYFKKTKLIRDTGRKLSRLTSDTKETSDGTVSIWDFVPSGEPTPEQALIEKESKKTVHDQKRLITYFFEQNKDPITKEILERIPHHENLNSVAKEMGLQLIQVQRKLAKLKRFYDESLFGSDYFEYLRV